MDPQFWHQRWQRGEIGFHQPHGNASLRAGVEALGVSPPGRVLVPLCGRSPDLVWLRELGFEVVGAELSEIAVQAFFEQLKLEPERVAGSEGTDCLRAAGYDMHVGDFFDLSSADCGEIALVADRAALVALPAETRRRYAAHVLELAGTAPVVLVTLDYDQAEMSGPPFAVADEEVLELFDARRVERWRVRDVLGEESRLRERGLSGLRETCWLLR